MPLIELETVIKAPIEIVFDLSRSIELHEKSTSKTNEKAIAGKTYGFMEIDESVTWRAKHLGIYQKLTVVISKMERPYYFEDKMVKGAFKSFSHEHFFEQKGEITIMKDIFNYTSPLWIIGKIADFIFLKNYMTTFLKERNNIIKEYAEDEKLRNNF